VNDLDGLTREELVALVLEQQAVILALQEEIDALRPKPGGGSAAKTTPDWVKANRAERPKKERKKRHKSFVRRRERATEIVPHDLECCPDCGRRLSGGTVRRVRQVIEIPVAPVRIVEHRIIGRYCGVCRKIQTPHVDLSQYVVGTHRVGVRVMSLVAYMNIVGRMTKRTIQSFLKTMYKLHLGLGEISEILHTVAKLGKKDKDKLLEAVRGSPYINADETGWPEDGKNGYVWTFSSKDVRYFVFRRSRSGAVAREAIGENYAGTIVTDCYGGYNGVLADRQVCWAHLARDLHSLAEEHPKNEDVARWAKAVMEVYHRAKGFSSKSAKRRRWERVLLEEEMHRLTEPYLESDDAQRVLAQRLEKHLCELFVFVEDPEVPSDNNGAERALRPVVITRKVCGGSRSEKGSETKMTLMSLFGTWKVRGLDVMEACRLLLTGHSVLFPQTS